MGAKCGKPENSKEERLRRQHFLEQSQTSTQILDRYASLTRTGSPQHRPPSSTLSSTRLYGSSPVPQLSPSLRRTQSTQNFPPSLLTQTPEPYEFRASNSSIYPLKITDLKSSDREKGFSDILSSETRGWSPTAPQRRITGRSGSSGFGSSQEFSGHSGGQERYPESLFEEDSGAAAGGKDLLHESLEFKASGSLLLDQLHESDQVVPVTPPPRLKRKRSGGSNSSSVASSLHRRVEEEEDLPPPVAPRRKKQASPRDYSTPTPPPREHLRSYSLQRGEQTLPLIGEDTFIPIVSPRAAEQHQPSYSIPSTQRSSLSFQPVDPQRSEQKGPFQPIQPRQTSDPFSPTRKRESSPHAFQPFSPTRNDTFEFPTPSPPPHIPFRGLFKQASSPSRDSPFQISPEPTPFKPSRGSFKLTSSPTRDSPFQISPDPTPLAPSRGSFKRAPSPLRDSPFQISPEPPSPFKPSRGSFKRVPSPPRDSPLQKSQEPPPPPQPTKRKKMTLGSKPPPMEENGSPDAPKFVREMSDVVVKVGTRGRLLVEVDPNFGAGSENETLKITWYRNDQRITIPQDPSTSRIRQTSEGRFHYLDISPVTTDDEGKWICVAENFRGRTSCASQVKVMVPKSYTAPSFVEGLRAVLTEAGTVSLECKVIGTPTPLLKWYKDGVEIKAGDIFALRGDPSSLGVYTCEAVNCLGSVTSSSRVHVHDTQSPSPSKIQITHPLQDIRIRVGERAELSLATSIDLPESVTVNWYNKSTLVTKSDRLIPRVEKNVCALFLNPVEIQDDGEWVCEIGVGKDKEKIVSSCVMSLLVPRNYRRPKFLEDLKAILTEEGLVSFECKVCGFPTPILHWFKDGYELKPGDVYQLSGANSLGKYSCIAHNCMGSAESSTELTLEDIQHQLSDDERKALIAEGVGSKRPPKFITGLKSVEMKIGDPCELFVELNDPRCTIQWVRDGAVIDVDGDKYNVRRDGCTCVLYVKELEFDDQAEWKCNASNEYGHSVSCACIRLVIPANYKKPKFLESLRAVLSEEGTVNLECKVIGVPVPLLKWYKDGVELKAGDIHRIISGADGTCCLGTYMCVARNIMGEVSSSAALLGFEDKLDKEAQNAQAQRDSQGKHNLTRDPSLSTIMEERTSQMLSVHDSPNVPKSIEEEDGGRGDVSVSIDGKDVSVSLYETPDLTENDARQIIEMFANEYSEYISEQGVVPMPSLRFIKETSTSGNIVMEAVVIDVTDDPFDTAKSASMGGVLREDPTENDYNDDEFSDSFESPMELSATSDLPEDGKVRSRPGSLREKRRHSESLSRRSSEKKRKEEVKCGIEAREVTSQELEMFGNENTSVYLSADSERSNELEGKRDGITAVEEFERMIGEGLMMAGVSQDVHFSGAETLKFSGEVGYTAFGGLEGSALGLVGQDVPGVYENFESMVSGGGGGGEVRGDVGIVASNVAGGFSPGVFSNVGEFCDDFESLKNAEEVNVFGGDRFVGIEMAEMVLEGADTFSDVESIPGTVAVEKLESGSFGVVGVGEEVLERVGEIPQRPVRKKRDESLEKGRRSSSGQRGESTERGEDAGVQKPPRRSSSGQRGGDGSLERKRGSAEIGEGQEVVQKPPRRSSSGQRGSVAEVQDVEGQRSGDEGARDASLDRGEVKRVEDGGQKPPPKRSSSGQGEEEGASTLERGEIKRGRVEGGEAQEVVQKPPRRSSSAQRASVAEVQEVERGRADVVEEVKKPPRKRSCSSQRGSFVEGEVKEGEEEGVAKEVGRRSSSGQRGGDEKVEIRETEILGDEGGDVFGEVAQTRDKEGKGAKIEEETKREGIEEIKKKDEEDARVKREEAKKEANEKGEKDKKDADERKEIEAKEKAEKRENERQAKEKEAKARAEEEAVEKKEREKGGEEKAMKEKEAKEKAEKEAKAEKEKAEKLEKEKAEKEAKEKDAKEKEEKAQKEREAKEKGERDAKEKSEKEAKLKAENEAKEKAEKEAKLKADKEAKEKAEKLEKEKKEAKEKADKEAAEKKEKELKEKEAKEKAEKEAKEKADKEAKLKAEKEAKEKAEKDQKEKEAKLKAEKDAKEKAEKEAAEKKEREAKEKADKLEKEKAEKIRAEKEAKEAKEKEEKAAKLRAEKEAAEKKEQEEKEAKLRAEKEAKEKAKKEQEAKERDEKEKKEKAEKLEKEKKEREAKEKAEKEAKEKAQKEAKEKTEREAKEKADKEAKEKAEKLEKEKKEREAAEKKEKAEKEAKLKAEREEKEKTEKLEKEREAKEKAEKLEKEKKEREAAEKEAKLKAQREEKEKAERLEKEKNEKEAAEKKEREANEKAEKEKADKLEKEREEKADKAQREAKEKADKDAKLKAEKEAKEKAEKEAKEKAQKLEKEAKEKADKEKAEKEAQEKAQKEKSEKAEKLEKEKKEREKAEKEAKEKAEKEAKEKADKEAKLKADKEMKEKAEKLEKEKEAKEKSEREAKEKAEKDAKEKAQKEAKEKEEKDAKLKAEKEAKEKAEKEAKEKAQKLEKEAKERADKEAKDKGEKEKAQKEKEAKEKAQKETKEKEEKDAKSRSEKEAKEKAEKDKEAKENAEKLKSEKGAKEKQEVKGEEKSGKETGVGYEGKNGENGKLVTREELDNANEDRIIKQRKEEEAAKLCAEEVAGGSKRASLDGPFKIKTVKKVNKIELQSLKLEGDKVEVPASPPVDSKGKKIGSPVEDTQEVKIEGKKVAEEETGKEKRGSRSGGEGEKRDWGKPEDKVEGKKNSQAEESKGSEKKGAAKSTEPSGGSRKESVKSSESPASTKESVKTEEQVVGARKGSIKTEEQVAASTKGSVKNEDQAGSRKGSVKAEDKPGKNKPEVERKTKTEEKNGSAGEPEKVNTEVKKTEQGKKAESSSPESVTPKASTKSKVARKSSEEKEGTPKKDVKRKGSQVETVDAQVSVKKVEQQESTPMRPARVVKSPEIDTQESGAGKKIGYPDSGDTVEEKITPVRVGEVEKQGAHVGKSYDRSVEREEKKARDDNVASAYTDTRSSDYSGKRVSSSYTPTDHTNVHKTPDSYRVSDQYTTQHQKVDHTPPRHPHVDHHHESRSRGVSTLPRTGYYESPTRGSHLDDFTTGTKFSRRQRDVTPNFRLTERAKSYDHLPGYYYGQDTFSGESRGVVTCGGGKGLLVPGFSAGVYRSQNIIERTRDSASPSLQPRSKSQMSLEDLTLIEQTRSFSRELRQEKVKAMTRKWKTDEEREHTLAELDELPTHEFATPPPSAPPRRRRNNYQVKVSSEAEDIYGGVKDISTGLFSMPSYFTTPSVGYSYFSMAGMSPGGTHTPSGSFLALDEAHRMKRPRFSMKLQNRTTPENTEVVKFACTVFGTPEPTIQWYKNGIPIFSDRQKYLITSSCGVCTLDIRDVDKHDTGEYTCFARNFYGKAASSAILQVVGVEGSTCKAIIPDSRPGVVLGEKCIPVCFSTGIMETHFPEVNELVLECQVKGTPRPEIMWTKNGSEIISYGQTTYGRFRADYANIFETGKCRLIIQRPRESDSGVYTCVGRNYDYSAVGRKLCWTDEITKCVNVKVAGNTSPKGGLYSVSTIYPASSSFEYQAPRFITELEPSKRVRVGGEIALTVEITGVPQPDVRWFHHKNTVYPIKPSTHTRIINEAPGVHTLYIPEVDNFDYGTYTVRVVNKYGMVESSCSVQELIPGVNDSPTISGIRAGRKPADNSVQPRFVREPRENYTLKYGEDLVIECEVEGWPQVSVNLYRGCRNVTLQPRAYKELSPPVPESSNNTKQSVKFTITNMHCTDFGLYSVEVKNICGSAKAFVNVKLFDPHNTRSTRSMTPGFTHCGLSPASSTSSQFLRSQSPYLQSTSNLTLPRPYLPNPNPRSISTRSLLHQTHTSSTFGLHLRGSSPSLRKLSCSSHMLSREY